MGARVVAGTALWLIGAILLPAETRGEGCIDYLDYLHLVGSAGDTPGHALDVAVAGSYAYIADGYSGLQVIDISNPAVPAIVGSVDTPDSAVGAAVAGAYAYVADGYSGLQVIDISNPRFVRHRPCSSPG